MSRQLPPADALLALLARLLAAEDPATAAARGPAELLTPVAFAQALASAAAQLVPPAGEAAGPSPHSRGPRAKERQAGDESGGHRGAGSQGVGMGARKQLAAGAGMSKRESRPDADAPALAAAAAAMAWTLTRERPPLARGNGALAFLAVNLVLELNGLYLDVTEGAALETMSALADGRLPEAALARWIADHSYPLHRWYA